MILRFVPNDAEPGEPGQSYSIKPAEIRSIDAEAIEAVGNDVWESFWAWEEQFKKNKTRAMRAAMWIARRRDEPDLTFDQVDFARGEVWVEWDNEERRDMRQSIRNRKGISEEARAALLNAIPVPDGGDEDTTPLEPSVSPNDETTTPTDGTNTGG